MNKQLQKGQTSTLSEIKQLSLNLTAPTMRKKSMARVLCMYLMRVGMCFKKDLTLIGKQFGKEEKVYETISNLINTGYITETLIKGKKSRPTTALSLSRAGRIALLNKLYEEKDEYWNKDDNSVRAYNNFKTVNETKLIRRLTDASIQTWMFISNVRVFRKDKPRMYSLYRMLLGASDDTKEQDEQDGYARLYSKEEAQDYLDGGLYYSMDEVREYAMRMDSNTDNTDTFNGCRARGIVLTNKTCFVIYSERYQANSMIRLTMDVESRMLSALTPILRVTDVFRTLDGFDKKSADGTIDHAIGQPYALVMCNGEALVYSMATGSPKGHVGKNSSIDVQLDKRKYYKEVARTNYYVLLDGVCPLYKRVFAIPKNATGMESLKYLVQTSAEEWLDDSKEKLSNVAGVREDNFDPLYPYFDQSQRIMYMPVYEVKELYTMYQKGYAVSILTKERMTDTIAHSARVDIKYYDEDTYQEIHGEGIAMYDKNGYYKGQQIIKDMLANKFIFVDNKVWKELPTIFNMSEVEFYNAVCENKIDMNMVFAICEQHQIEPSTKKRIRHSSISLSMSEDLAKDIKKAAKYRNMSQSAYIKSLIAKQARTDARAYEELIKENRKYWKATLSLL